ncbi:DAPG hydrolase family protein [Sphingobium sp. MK2]|uniref:DAPG hydrolase family protein n=1 Tax=Sphingobium sp. MK2 TaxID=3116540 RepID=UPI0032E358B1
MKYQVTSADRLPIPTRYHAEKAALGYSAVDLGKPHARYFSPKVARIQDHVLDAIALGLQPAEYAYTIDEAGTRLGLHGYEPMETGVSVLRDGRFMIAVHTLMPRVTAQMWDWWFAWHGHETARYKLWHPEAHARSAMAEDRRGIGLPWSQQYINNVSYVSEYLGGQMDDLTIRFVDPGSLGFQSAPDSLVVAGRLGPTAVPIAVGWGAHQLRPIEGGCEMRSRFFLNEIELLAIPADCVSSWQGKVMARMPRWMASPLARRIRLDPATFGTALMTHCAQEMNHLAGILPNLFEHFKDAP